MDEKYAKRIADELTKIRKELEKQNAEVRFIGVDVSDETDDS